MLPTPIASLKTAAKSEWLELHQRLLSQPPAVKKPRPSWLKQATHTGKRAQPSLFEEMNKEPDRENLLNELNDRVYGLLDLDDSERVLVEDFVHVRYAVNKGKVWNVASEFPQPDELNAYAAYLSQELDAFFEDDPNYRHAVAIIIDEKSRSGLIEIETHRNSSQPIPPRIEVPGNELSANLAHARKVVREKHSQWLYFNRNLRIYEGRKIFVVKPLQRIHWLRSQALLDADAILADLVSQGE